MSALHTHRRPSPRPEGPQTRLNRRVVHLGRVRRRASGKDRNTKGRAGLFSLGGAARRTEGQRQGHQTKGRTDSSTSQDETTLGWTFPHAERVGGPVLHRSRTRADAPPCLHLLPVSFPPPSDIKEGGDGGAGALGERNSTSARRDRKPDGFGFPSPLRGSIASTTQSGLSWETTLAIALPTPLFL